jgi:peptide/nickel transport system permease protein
LAGDVLSRMVFGTRVSLTIGFAAVAVGGLVGGLLGLVAGFRGGWVDEVVMTVADAQLAFPFILLAIGIIAVLGPSFPNLIVVVGLSGWVTYARVLRSQVLSLRQRDFVSAILALGGSVPRVLLRHVLPNVASTFMVVATLELARAIVLEATRLLASGSSPSSWAGHSRGANTDWPGGSRCAPVRLLMLTRSWQPGPGTGALYSTRRPRQPPIPPSGPCGDCAGDRSAPWADGSSR